MFNNPFDSFHNTVAEAKEEREQLDRLLTISTPRERLLVGAIAALLVTLAAWLLFGTVHRSVALEGVLVEPESPQPGSARGLPLARKSTSEENRSVQVLVWVHRGVVPDIALGMPALIELAVDAGDAAALDGEVAAIAPVGLSEVPAFGSSAPVSIHRVDIALDESLDFGSLAAMECRVVIEVGRQSPLALFGMR
ncbi:MAG: hypothetical protein OXU77_13775 [Gammaproteobacteria bacterium]|nr:hypothetical protein [Gammaproteobacteria bacterium]